MIKRTLYFGNPAYLSLKNAQMVIRLPEIKEWRVLSEKENYDTARIMPIEDIGFVILDNPQICITQGLIDALVSNNCAVMSCDKSHMPTSLLLPLAGNTLQSERFKAQIQASLPLKKQLWQQTIRAKISNQASVLKKYSDKEIGCMLSWAEEVRSNDSMNLEARAAAYYWRNIFSKFTDFKRSQDGEYPNNFLNYGYAILRSVIARALICAGLLPTLGIHHSNRYNAYCLADDIMEPYRPYIDMVVLNIMHQHTDEISLTQEIKKELLSIPVLDVKIKGKRCPLMIGATHTANSLLKCFEGELKKIVYPEM